MGRLIDKRQYRILSERYFEVLLGDLPTLAWMIGQAPLIAGIVILRWRAWPATESLFFVIALSAVWFGCINACREIAREASIYRRERRFGLSRTAYLAAKMKILGLIGLAETALFHVLIHRAVDTDLILAPALIALIGLNFAGMSLGLMLSRWCRTPARAVAAVPVAIIPQIVFSKFVLPAHTLEGAAARIETLMPVKWGFEALTACRIGEARYGEYATSLLALAGLTALFALLTLFHLYFAGDDE